MSSPARSKKKPEDIAEGVGSIVTSKRRATVNESFVRASDQSR